MDILEILLIFIMALIAVFIVFLVQCIVNERKKINLEEYKINIDANISEETFKLLDTIIEECFMEYTVLNIEYKDINYINSELETQITREVAHKVMERLSPTLMSKISLVYNINSFSTLLSERVYLHTLDYSIKKNSIKEK